MEGSRVRIPVVGLAVGVPGSEGTFDMGLLRLWEKIPSCISLEYFAPWRFGVARHRKGLNFSFSSPSGFPCSVQI